MAQSRHPASEFGCPLLTQSGHGRFIAEGIVLGAMKRSSLPLIRRAVTGAASPVGRPAPRDYHQRDDAEQRGGHQVIGGR